MNQGQDELYAEYTSRFETMDDEQLDAALENQRKNPGWVSAKAVYMAALRNEIDKRRENVAEDFDLEA